MFSWWGSSNDDTEVDMTCSSKESPGGEINESTDTAENNATSHKDATETAKDLAKNLGSFFYSVANVATQTAVKVKETVEGKSDILGDFNKEQEKFVTEKHSKRKETGVAPWVGYHEEETMKSQILALSSDERNFLRDPPAGVQFVYDYDSMFPVALATLEEDPELKKMRFNLVPKKVKEINFWRNYFYRVSLIKQSSQLTSLASATGNVSGSSENQTKTNQLNTEISAGTSQTKPREIGNKAASENPNDDLGDMALSSSPTQEFISDAYGGSQELSNEDLKQIGVERLTDNTENDHEPISKPAKEANPVTSKSNPVTSDQPTESTEKRNLPDWERELQEELQEYDVVVNEEGDDDDDGSWEKEIEDMLDAAEES